MHPDLLKALPISPELGAFVALVMLFLWAISRWINSVNRTMADVANQNNAHNKAIADEFQSIVRDMNAASRLSQKNYQEQMQTLTDSHIRVSRELVAGIQNIETGFRVTTAKLEHVEEDVRHLKGHLGGPG